MRFLRACLPLVAGCLIAVAGCKPDDEISVATVTHPDRQPIRICVGAIPRADVIWFFRISGPSAEVAKHLDEFKDFVRSAKFAQDKEKKEETATMTQPNGWQKDLPTRMRFAGYRIKAEPKELEVTVTRLPADDNWLLMNVHRWQKQVNLPPAAKKDEIEPFVTREKEITWIDLSGLGVHSVSKPPEAMAANAQQFQLPELGKKPAARGAKSPFIYMVPEDWKPGQITNEFTAARFEVGDVQISLTTLGGSVAMNVNRWRKEVGLPEIANAAEAERTATEMKVAGLKAYYVDLANPEGPPTKKRTLAFIVPMEGTNWFVKMWGPAASVEQHKNAFETFVKSFKLD